MLEHSAMYLNVPPPYEDDASFFSDICTRVGSCELQDPVWGKMNALTGLKQKRKKSENKPQTQLNKCNNEKRRREQENIYIEELAELISANFADMSSLSVKPDKCAILQETVNQIRRIKQQDNSNQQIVDPVQQGEVSSSRPTIISNDVYGPLLLEALEGFLFVINGEGKVEHVTENVSNYLKFTKDEIIGKSIYNYMHHGDHTKFHASLLPMTIDWCSSEQSTTSRSKSVDVRMRLRSDHPDDSIEDKSQTVHVYELMHISSTLVRDLSVTEDDGSDAGPCLLCVASRITHRDKASCFLEQFTTKLDTNGKIICVDTSGVSESVSQVLRKDIKGLVLRDLVPQQDVHKVTAHLKETLSSGTSTSSIYHIQLSPDKLVQVQTKSKFFKTNPLANSDTDFIMATHSIIGDNDTLDPGGGMGGPLMTSVVNGAGPVSRNGPSSAPDPTPPSSSATSSSSLMPATPAGSAFTQEFLDNDFPSLDFPSTTWDHLETAWPDAGRPSSRQSVTTPVSTPTPRPPSNPSYSNAPTVVQSPMAHYSSQPSPANQTQQNSHFISFMDDFQDQNVYPVDDQKDTKANVLEEVVSHPEPQRLRSLLTNPPTSNASSSSASVQQDDSRDRILKGLLNQQDDDHSSRMDNRNNHQRGLMSRGTMMQPSKSTASSSSENKMLRSLLNDNNDDDDIEAKAGLRKSSELLQRLKKDTDEDDDKKRENGPHDDLLKTLGFPSDSPGSASDRRGSKRTIEDKDDRDAKRSNNGPQVSSSGAERSEIYQRNKMLASLLENPTPTPPSIPPIPAKLISATPHETLPRVTTDPAKLIGGTMAQNNNNNNNRGNNSVRILGRPQGPYYMNNIQRSVPAFILENNNWVDPDLSEILDQVIDIVPDSSIMHMLDPTSRGPQTSSLQLSETDAIQNIQNSLMQIENAVPPSPNVSLPARPPAYNANVSSQNSLGYPPPNYPHVKARPMGGRGAGPPYSGGNLTTQQQLRLEQQKKLQQLQVESQKQRLLYQQRQQQLLIPSNATAAEMNSIQNFDSLLNNTVAPNVTLQRSNSVPESQLSPNFTNQLQGSNSRGVVPQPNQQQPYSPHSQLPSPLGQQSFTPQTTATGNYNPQRLSPQSQFTSQLSPRQTYPSQGNGSGSGNNWPQQQQRLAAQNPMLNAQLTGTLTGRGNFQRPPTQQPQQQRALNSPGGVPGAARHSPFGGDQFAPPSSPNATFNQTQYLQRLQRANSVPTTSSQMTGGLGSPRPYSGNSQALSHYPPNPLHSIPPNPMLYQSQQQMQQDSYNCYEQPSLPPSYERRPSAPAQHLQSGVGGSNPTSELVRQELRAMVGARTAQSQPGGGNGQRSGPSPAQQLQQQLGQHPTVDLDSLGISFEMPSGASDSPKLWGAMGSEMGSMSPQPATSRTTMEEGRPGDHAKTSLLQQLLSDQSK